MGAYGPPPGFYRNSPRVKIDAAYCTGCLKCVSACPLNGRVLRARRRNGEVHAEVEQPERCVGCGRCVNACPTHAVGIFLV